ncbi:MAG: Peptidyl-prolyl cis-trans isomerase cyclophilin type [Candidatus Amesbacteria bacterium GW2011_GWB1_47_26]|uniref:Peptidyl-prolyl cis-trans isomerase n=1 Tax=Candidatus Amesbacteria bacterium GW2011_GWC2_45_19 TaxID=1618366 RepID=A0A0G1PCR6_9BACT|nr:MAG: Peptidyl-prolyl cis-trans isomerase cyclophilin type [Candidatus Amesbacteria bacterium GW2011_GWC2_45_19]KKU38657.1 MAG: Peptidyl-prolyl cis-trans isomerase cyclophilin type [Candidatus Amesbacteria bacterium GW2011_GWA1_46_35]KKU68638.1 MAG: Peptidyl-prolyl cis-trans isomerase cyclophilin type [Microgenomates group bacterium GW2011_GWC1_47_20]KKU74977.1 MAG: Peptidyl-prolyl cis-trans isomerase cyclophilin type [Candidatus Amesbacteria bacterium GW2011_GWB1_47_26]KKU79011.1 MAG: Peptid
MNRNSLIAAIVVIAAIIVGLVISRNYRKTLSTGKITQATPTAGESGTLQQPLKTKPQILISTSKGDFTIELRPDVAPKTVTNFLAKFNSGYCDNLTWHRIEDWVVQGCDPAGNGNGGQSNLPTETSGESFVVGSVGVARKDFPKEVSNDSQFFIVKKDSQFLNGEYTYFGRVVSGMDTVNKLSVGNRILSTTILSK